MSSNKKTVLVVEDEGYILHVLETVLNASGYRALTAQSAHAANTVIASHMRILKLGTGKPFPAFFMPVASFFLEFILVFLKIQKFERTIGVRRKC